MTALPSFQAAFGAAVAARRRALPMSQEAFADRCGLDRTYVSGVERGRRNPTLAVIRRIADGLGVPPSDLLRDAERAETTD